MADPPFLAAREVTVRFGGLVAVSDVSLEVDQAEIVGVIGPNGAGKTTLFNAIAGAVTPDHGTVHLAGGDVTAWPSHRRARSGLGRTFQRLEVFGSMTVHENLAYATEAAALGASPWHLLTRDRHRRPKLADETIDLLGLGAVASVPAGDLPTGTARLVEFGRALCAEPSVVLLDEPSSGLDATETAFLAGRIGEAVAQRGMGVLLIEHDMSVVLGICERLYVLDFGELIAAGPTREVAELPRVRDAYLGTSHAG